MMVLVACEESQAVTKAFRAKGHEAWSCDVVECSGGHPEWHLQQDVLPLLKEQWDMIIAFPPCTDLCVSGAKWFAAKRADGRQQASIDFFMEFTRANSPCVAIENPIGIMSRLYRKPDQIIQPWQFGHDASKATCLWLSGLPPLTPTNILPGGKTARRANQTPSGQNKLGPSADRARLRAVTYSGIAEAMADQWSNVDQWTKNGSQLSLPTIA
jgi:hypothetical protein